MNSPSDWEPLGHTVGPFGPSELEIREYQKDASQSKRTWQVRIAARPDVVALALPSDFPAVPRSLESVDQIKWAVAFHLRALVPRTFGDARHPLPESFHF